MKLCDENTIGVVAILGSTFDGSYEPVKEICDALDAFAGARRGSTFRCTSTARPARWSRRSSTPTSSGTSASRASRRSTRRGTSTASCTRASAGSSGATRTALPEDLIFWVNYLGDNMPTFALNFSRPGAQVVAQYYNFLRLGFEGYRRVQGYARDVATRLSGRIAELGPFELLTRGDELPVFAFTLKDDVDELHRVRRLERAARARLAGARRTRSRRTGPTSLRSASSSGAGFTHDMADMLVARPRAPASAAREAAQLRSIDEATGSAFAH